MSPTFWRGTAPPRGPSRVARLRQAEKAFLANVVELAALRGYAVYHTFDSRRSAAGFPDLVLVKGGRVIFAELKTETGEVSAPQQGWLDALGQCDQVEVYLWRPSQWRQLDAILA